MSLSQDVAVSSVIVASSERVSGTDELRLKHRLHFKTICPTQGCTTPLAAILRVALMPVARYPDSMVGFLVVIAAVLLLVSLRHGGAACAHKPLGLAEEPQALHAWRIEARLLRLVGEAGCGEHLIGDVQEEGLRRASPRVRP